MKRITISLPDEIAARVEREARRDQTSVSEIVRRNLTSRFGISRDAAKRHIPFAGLFASGHTDTAERHDEILADVYERRHAERQARQGDCARDR